MRRSIRRLGGIALALVLLVGACSDDGPEQTLAPHDPYPYTTPTPPEDPTALDGTYGRLVTAEVVGADTPCRRCPPYRLAVGHEILGLERGVFEVYHHGSGYMSVGHYTVDGDTITFFNDPNCPKVRGTYRAEGNLSFVPVDDPCAFDQVRLRFLSSLPWRPITPPEGIFLEPGGTVLLLLDGVFAFGELWGDVTISGERLTIEADGCVQEFAWSVDDGTLDLLRRGNDCPWASDLSDTDWTPVG
jgi:hypothetical protein